MLRAQKRHSRIINGKDRHTRCFAARVSPKKGLRPRLVATPIPNDRLTKRPFSYLHRPFASMAVSQAKHANPVSVPVLALAAPALLTPGSGTHSSSSSDSRYSWPQVLSSSQIDVYNYNKTSFPIACRHTVGNSLSV